MVAVLCCFHIFVYTLQIANLVHLMALLQLIFFFQACVISGEYKNTTSVPYVVGPSMNTLRAQLFSFQTQFL